MVPSKLLFAPIRDRDQHLFRFGESLCGNEQVAEFCTHSNDTRMILWQRLESQGQALPELPLGGFAVTGAVECCAEIRKNHYELYERGSTGRQYVLDAFHERRLVARVTLETTSTETIVSMVEAGLGVSIVPLLPSGAVTLGRRVGVRQLASSIRPFHSGMLSRRARSTPAPPLD